MEPVDYLRFVASLLFVLALIGLIAWAVRRGGLAGGLMRGLSLGRAWCWCAATAWNICCC